MAHISITTAAVGLVIMIGGASSIAAEPLIRAVVVDGQVYVSPLTSPGGGEPSWKEPGGHFTLLGQGLAQGDPPITLRHPDVVDGHPFGNKVLHRWQIDRKRVHFLTYGAWEASGVEPFERNKRIQSYPLELVKSLTAPVATTLKDNARRQELDRTRTGGDTDPPGTNKQLGRPVTGWNSECFRFDFLPATDGRYEWYFSERDGKQSRISRWDSQPPVKKGEKTKWEEMGVWTPGEGGAFFATAAGLDRNFVTETGRVFAAPRGAKAGTPLKEIWKGPPVEVLIHDADNAKWYAFTKDEYFEIADPIKPKPHTPS